MKGLWHKYHYCPSSQEKVLMYPVLLDDQSLFTEFEKFMEAVDNMHELTLAGEQQFPGIYALFFFKRRVCSVGHRLAGFMGRLRWSKSNGQLVLPNKAIVLCNGIEGIDFPSLSLINVKLPLIEIAMEQEIFGTSLHGYDLLQENSRITNKN